MRNPYIVGRWLSGTEHYGRQRLLEYLIHSPDPAIWVVGTRRMGKTSLLRQLESLTDQADSPLVPLFWDIQGCETPEDLSYDLCTGIEDKSERFEALGIDVNQLYTMDVIRIIQTLQRVLRQSNRKLFLLIDETEALINLGEKEGQFLARLRKIFQNGSQRTVMASTKSLMRLNDLNSNWLTSPFLFGVSLVNLWSLDPEAAADLVLQKQSDEKIVVNRELLDEILVHTHRHPYLIQYLCQRLFIQISEDSGTLRPIQDEDLRPDHQLAGFFQVDFEHLAPMERQILLTVSRYGLISEERLAGELARFAPGRVSMFAYGMHKLGYLRTVYGQWTLGNEFLRRWVTENYDQLSLNVQSQVSDAGVESLLVVGRQIERNYLQQEMVAIQAKLDELLLKRNAYDNQAPIELSMQIQEQRRQLNAIAAELGQLDASTLPALPILSSAPEVP
jgi:hypothetical protein